MRLVMIEDLKIALGVQAQFVGPLDATASLLLYPGGEANYVISNSLTKASQRLLCVICIRVRVRI